MAGILGLNECVVCGRPLSFRGDHQCDPRKENVIDGCRRRETDGREKSEADRLAEGFRLLHLGGDT